MYSIQRDLVYTLTCELEMFTLLWHLKGLVHDWQRVADFSYNCVAEHCHLQVKDLARISKNHLLMEDITSVNTCIQ